MENRFDWELNGLIAEEAYHLLRVIKVVNPGDERQVNQQQKAILYIHMVKLTAFPQHIPFLRL